MANKDAYEEQMDRREFRRKRRIRNQIISYIVTVIVLGGLVAGGIIGAGQVMKTVRDKKQADELQKQLDELAQQEEETPVVEAPVESPEPATEQDYLDEIVNACIAEMPLEDKVAGLFIITPEALTGTDVVVKAGDTTKAKVKSL